MRPLFRSFLPSCPLRPCRAWLYARAAATCPSRDPHPAFGRLSQPLHEQINARAENREEREADRDRPREPRIGGMPEQLFILRASSAASGLHGHGLD